MKVHPHPIAWTNQPLILYHGTIERFAEQILHGLDITSARADTDFGKGFYTTTWKQQAVKWSRDRASYYAGEEPFVVEFVVDRNALSSLRILSFVRGQHHAEDFWSLVHTCRLRSTDHRVTGKNWYDVVSGPVALLPVKKRRVLAGYDQFSFHTKQATDLLDSSKKNMEHVK